MLQNPNFPGPRPSGPRLGSLQCSHMPLADGEGLAIPPPIKPSQLSALRALFLWVLGSNPLAFGNPTNDRFEM